MPGLNGRERCLAGDPLVRTSRRSLLASSSAVALGFSGLRALSGRAPHAYGGSEITPSLPKTDGKEARPGEPAERLFDLPEGFSYSVVSRFGERMSDGLR